MSVRVAERLEGARQGDLVILSKGGVLSRRAVRTKTALRLAPLVAVIGVVAWANPIVGAAAAVVATAAISTQVAAFRRSHRIVQAILAWDLDGAERLCARADRLAWSDRRRANLASHRANIAWRRGRLDEALRWCDRSIALLPRPVGGFSITYWQVRMHRVSILAETGEVAAARAALADAGRAPRTPWYQLHYRAALLHVAFVAGSTDGLPADETLHDWTRDALRYNHTSTLLALLGWALEARGDHDLAQHALAETPTRMLGGSRYLEACMPRVWAWLAPALDRAEAAADAAS